MATLNKRCIGQILHADPFDISNGPDGFTIDWAIIHPSKDTFNWAEFKGNKVYICTFPISLIDTMLCTYTLYHRVQDQRASLLRPHVSQRCPPGWLCVPESEIRRPTQRNACGDPTMPVIKNGLTTGTTVGWVNGLKSLVRQYDTAHLPRDHHCTLRRARRLLRQRRLRFHHPRHEGPYRRPALRQRRRRLDQRD